MSAVVAGLDKQRLLNINAYLEECISHGKLSGASIAVIRKNILVHESYHGYQNIEKKIALTKDSIFRINSMTKPIVSVGLMMLYEKGKFKLTDPVKLYIPSFNKTKLCGIYDYDKNKNIKNVKLNNIHTKPIKSQIRIWQLLTHTSGLSYGLDKYGKVSPVDKLYNDNASILYRRRPQSDNISVAEFINERLTKMPLRFEPGTKWNYSLATDVVGRLIEVLSGMKLDEYLKANIFDPLQMNDTSFYIPQEKKHRFTALYMPYDTKSVLAPKLKSKCCVTGTKLINISDSVQFCYDKNNKYLSGGSGLVSTLEDYKQFTLMLLNNGKGMNGKQIVSTKIIR
eukprot:239403_1